MTKQAKHCFFASTLAQTTHLGFQFNMAASSSSKGPSPSKGRESDARKAAAKAKPRRSGKSNWAKVNQERKARVAAKKRRELGLPVVRLRNKQTVSLPAKGRTIQRAKRVDDEVFLSHPPSQEKILAKTNCPVLKTKGVQTKYQFYTLADLPAGSDSLYEESESGSSFIDDVVQSPSSDDGFWSEKAYSI